MKAAGQLPGVTAIWDKAQRIKTQEGLRSCFVFTEGEIRNLTGKRLIEEAAALTRLYATFCNREASQQSNEEAVVTLRHAKGMLDYLDRQFAESKHYPKSLFRLILLTCNNLANVLKALGDPHRAYQYLSKAQFISQAHPPDSPSSLQYLASTHVNLSTLHLDLHQPLQAITCAEQGLRLLQARLSRASDSLSGLESRNKEQYEGLMKSYLCAMFNIAIGEERLGRKEEAMRSYTACLKFAKAYVPQAFGTIQEAETAVSEIMEATEREATTVPSASSRPQLTRRASGEYRSEKRLSQSVRLSTSQNTRDGDRYYSKERLEKLRMLLESEGKKPFMSSSQYFDIQIHKNLGLDSDMRHLTPVTSRALAKTLRHQTAEPDKERKSIASLRQRKYQRKPKGKQEERGVDYIQKRMWLLTHEPRPLLSKAASMRHSEYSDSQPTRPCDVLSSSMSRLQMKEEIEKLMGNLKEEMKSVSTSPERERKGRTRALRTGQQRDIVPVPPPTAPPPEPHIRSSARFKRTESLN